MLSFSLSVSNRQFIRKSNELYQIMPVQRGFLTSNTIDTYFKSTITRDILIHTSYMCRAFSPIALPYNSKIQALINQYFKFAQHIGASHILLHGPASPNEFLNFDAGLDMIDSIRKRFNDNNIKICIEIPSFTKEILNKETDMYSLIDNYFDKITQKNFEIVIDTAHTFSNRLSNDQVLTLLKKYDKYCTWIHLNGNLRPPGSSDVHCPMFDPKNLIPDFENYCKEIAKMNKKCISETVYKNYDEWCEFAKKCGFELISEEAFAQL